MTRIALVGLPGCGKSTVGRGLARRLDFPFIDSDDRIEQRIGCSIRSFFEEHGEDAFRDVEQAVIRELAQGDGPAVIATGGGAVLREDNRRQLRQGAQVIYLHAQPQDLYGRLRHDTKRPLLQVADPLARLQALYAQRDPLYREVAHLTIHTGRPNVRELVQTIASRLDPDPH